MICPKCGTELSGAEVCPECGYEYAPEVEEEHPYDAMLYNTDAAHDTGRHVHVLAILGIVLALLILLCVLVLSACRSSNSRSASLPAELSAEACR